MKENTLIYALQFLTGAIIIQMLMLAIPAQFAALPLSGLVPGGTETLLNIQNITAIQVLIFLIFDIVGGAGFVALVNGRGGSLLRSGA